MAQRVDIVEEDDAGRGPGGGTEQLHLGYTSGPLQRALQKVWVFWLFGPGPGGSGGPREAPEGPPWAFPGPRGLPEASGT